MTNILLAIYVIATSMGLVLIKLGAGDGAPVMIANKTIQFNLSPAIIIGVILYTISFILYTYLISKFDLGYIIPLTTALVYILIFTASFLLFKESFTVIKTLAISIIILGVILLNVSK